MEMMMMMTMTDMSGDNRYKPLDDTTAAAGVVATQDEDAKKSCTRCAIVIETFLRQKANDGRTDVHISGR